MSQGAIDPVPILWVVPHHQFKLDETSKQLAARGYNVLHCLPGESSKTSAAVRILQADLFQDIRALRDEYRADSRPTLIVASNEEQQIAALDFISDSGDVVRGPHPLELLTFRLARLLQKSAELARLHALQFEDPLTGLPNRRRMETFMVDFLDLNPTQDCRAVVLFDLDRFKAINDRYGHAGGDQILREFAAVLQHGAAPSDRFVRYGGEEFVCLLTRYDQETAIIDIEKILRRVENHDFFAASEARLGTSEASSKRFSKNSLLDEGVNPLSATSRSPAVRIPLTLSAGMTFVQPGLSGPELLTEADHALYSARDLGRNRLVVYQRMKALAAAENKDLQIEHFKNVARVLNDRMTDLVTRFAQNLVEEARREANHDYLTGLPNRRHFDGKLLREIERSDAFDRPLTIALMDLDGFGEINDQYGYPTGSDVLSRFAHIATGCVRSMDWIARYGGDEFCLVMPDTGLEAAMQIAERVRSSVESAEIRSLDQRTVRLTASVGVAQWSVTFDGPLRLLQGASDAVRAAKRGGGNRVVAAP